MSTAINYKSIKLINKCYPNTILTNNITYFIIIFKYAIFLKYSKICKIIQNQICILFQFLQNKCNIFLKIIIYNHPKNARCRMQMQDVQNPTINYNTCLIIIIIIIVFSKYFISQSKNFSKYCLQIINL